MSEPTVEITVPQSAELSHAMNAIFGLPEDRSSTDQKVEKAFNKMERSEKRLIEPQVTSQGVNKRPKGKKNKKTVNPKDLIDDHRMLEMNYESILLCLLT